MTNKLQQILKQTAIKYPLTLSEYDLQSSLEDLFEDLRIKGILRQTTPSYMVTCSSCGDAHRAINHEGSYITVCENNPSAGLEKHSKSELVMYKVSLVDLANFIGSCLILEIDPKEIESDLVWFIGRKHLGSNTFNFYLVRSEDLEQLAKIQNRINTANPVILFLGEDSHTGRSNGTILGLFDYISTNNSVLGFDKHRLYTHFPSDILAGKDDIVLDEHIVLSNKGGYFLLMRSENNRLLYKQKIRRQAFNIINYLYTIRNKNIKKTFSGKELVEATNKKLIGAPKLLSMRVNEVNNYCEKYEVKPIFHPFPNYRYGLNPLLDCLNSN